VREERRARAEDRLLHLLVPRRPAPPPPPPAGARRPPRRTARTRARSSATCCAPALEDRTVEIEVDETPTQSFEMFTPQGVEEVGVNLKDLMPGIFGAQAKQLRCARRARCCSQQEAEKLIDRQQLTERRAARRAGRHRVPRRDGQDRRAARRGRGPDVSREGVQRDLLPIVEGTTVPTKHGTVQTDHILFIGAGAFHVSRRPT
jgi:ATP-dependent HslUV protease ATP-binding subunit HslU